MLPSAQRAQRAPRHTLPTLAPVPEDPHTAEELSPANERRQHLAQLVVGHYGVAARSLHAFEPLPNVLMPDTATYSPTTKEGVLFHVTNRAWGVEFLKWNADAVEAVGDETKSNANYKILGWGNVPHLRLLRERYYSSPDILVVCNPRYAYKRGEATFYTQWWILCKPRTLAIPINYDVIIKHYNLIDSDLFSHVFRLINHFLHPDLLRTPVWRQDKDNITEATVNRHVIMIDANEDEKLIVRVRPTHDFFGLSMRPDRRMELTDVKPTNGAIGSQAY